MDLNFINYYMLYNWSNIIESNNDSINIIWYWSLLNTNTHNYDISILRPVIVKWFRRIYNIKLIPDNYTNDWLNNLKKYLFKYWIINNKDIIKCNKNNYCILNCEYLWNEDIMNWLLLNISKKDLLEFSLRESQYNLIKTNFDYINPVDGKIIWKWDIAYILVAKNEQIIKKWTPFLPYHNNVKKWAYSHWRYFWKIFEKSTFILWEN